MNQFRAYLFKNKLYFNNNAHALTFAMYCPHPTLKGGVKGLDTAVEQLARCTETFT